MGRSGRRVGSRFRLFDEVPKLGVVLELGVLVAIQIRAEQEVFQRMLVEDAMHDDSQMMPLKINPVIPQPIPQQDSTCASESPKFGAFTLNFQRKAPELAEDEELKVLRHPIEFGGTGRVKDDLEGQHPTVIVGNARAPRKGCLLWGGRSGGECLWRQLRPRVVFLNWVL